MAPTRIRGRSRFEAIRRAGTRARRGPVTATYLANENAKRVEVAYAIGRKVGSAVVRNRLRRRLRAIVSDIEPELAAGSYLIGANPQATSLSFEDLRNQVHQATKAANRETRP